MHDIYSITNIVTGKVYVGQIPWTKGKPGPMLGKHHTAVTCKRLGDAARGRPQSVATRAKRSASLRQHYAQKCLVENN